MDPPSPLFEQLLRQVGKTRRLARILLGDESAAEDAIQETWASASRRPLPETPEPWLRRALRNRLLNQARDDRRRTAREEKSLPGAHPDSPEDLLARLEMHRKLVEAVARLAEPYRQILLLRYFEELSSPEIGERLGVPAATVRGRLKTAVDLLREELDRAPGGRRAWMGAMVLLAGGGRVGAGAVGAVARVAAQGSSLVVKLVVALTVVGGVGTAVVVKSAPPAPVPAARAAPLPPVRFARSLTEAPAAPGVPTPTVAGKGTPAATAASVVPPAATPTLTPTTFDFGGWVVLAEPRPQPARFPMSDPGCPPVRDEEVVVGEKGALANVVVRVVSAVPTTPPPVAPLVIEQRNCQYHPRIAVAQVGQTIQLRSVDQVLHQAHGHAGTRTVAAGPLALGTPAVELAAPRPGETVRLGCDLHPWMTATVLGADSPWYAITDWRGWFAMPALPAGTYTVEAWHESYGTQRMQVILGPERRTPILNIAFGKEWLSPTGVTSGRGWPVAVAGHNECTIARKDDSPVARACKEGGIKKAKSVMKAMVKRGKEIGLKFACDDCHKDDANWTLTDGAEKKFKELLARQ